MIYILTPLGEQGVCWDWGHIESFSGAFTSFSNGTAFVSGVGSGWHCSEQLHIWLCHSCNRPPPSSTPMSPFNTCPSQFSPSSTLPTPKPPFLYACSLVYTHMSSHTFSLPEIRGALFFNCSHVAFHYHNLCSQFWDGGAGGKSCLFIPAQRTKLSAKIFFFAYN